MSNEYTSSSGSLSARLTDVSMEIDDDDEDVILAVLEMSNESAVPLGGVVVEVKCSNGSIHAAKEDITSLSPGSTRAFSFEFRLDSGQWEFMAKASGMSVNIGPFDSAFEYKAPAQKRLSSAIGSSLFSGAFDENFADYGNVQETELINPDEIQMTQYTIESASGGNQKITKTDEWKEEPAARTPPWMQKKQESVSLSQKLGSQEEQSPLRPSTDNLLSSALPFNPNILSPNPKTESTNKTSDVLLSTPLPSPQPQQEESRASVQSSSDILLQPVNSTPVDTQNKPQISPVIVPTPPAGPPSASTPTSEQSTASAPPTVPPSAPTPPTLPSGPPSSPPATKPALTKPAGPPSGPPAGPPSGPPTGPPAGPPAGPPSGPPTGPPSGPPSGPPKGPPSGPPNI